MPENIIVTIQLPPDDGSTQKQTTEEKWTQGAERTMKKMISYATGRALASNIISYEISQVSLRTGAKEYEQKLRFGYEIGGKGLNVLQATYAGAKLGGGFGAIVGLLGSTVYTAVGYLQSSNTLRTQQNLEDISINFANLRAGVSGRRGSRQ